MARSSSAPVARSLAKAALIGFVTLLVGCDHATKHAAATLLSGRRPSDLVPGVLDLRYTENHDSAFSLLARFGAGNLAPLLAVAGVLVLALLVGLWVQRRSEASRMEHLGFAFAVAGAVGNIADRLVRGYVVDFIHVRHWPVFNVADIAVVVGVALIVLASFKSPKPLLQ